MPLDACTLDTTTAERGAAACSALPSLVRCQAAASNCPASMPCILYEHQHTPTHLGCVPGLHLWHHDALVPRWWGTSSLVGDIQGVATQAGAAAADRQSPGGLPSLNRLVESLVGHCRGEFGGVIAEFGGGRCDLTTRLVGECQNVLWVDIKTIEVNDGAYQGRMCKLLYGGCYFQGFFFLAVLIIQFFVESDMHPRPSSSPIRARFCQLTPRSPALLSSGACQPAGSTLIAKHQHPSSSNQQQ